MPSYVKPLYKCFQTSSVCKRTARNDCWVVAKHQLQSPVLSIELIPPSHLHCIAQVPLFSHTTLFSTWTPTFLRTRMFMSLKNTIAGVWAIKCGYGRVVGIKRCKIKAWNVKRISQRCVFQAQSLRQYEKWRGMASAWGHRPWVSLRYGWRRLTCPIGGAGLIALTNRTVSFSSGHRLPLQSSVDIHVPGVLAPRIVSCTVAWWSNRRNCWKFSERRLVYKLVFTQYALFPQPSLWERLAGYGAEWGEWGTQFTIWMHFTPTGSKCLCYH